MEKVLWPYGHRASGQGPVSETVRHAMNPKEKETQHNNDKQIEPGLSHSISSDDDDNDDDTRRLLKKKKPIKGRHYYDDRPTLFIFNHERLRPYWLGLGLGLTLFSFWVMDSLKDPVFAILVDGNLDQHQPPAKLVSVGTTLILVCVMEFCSHWKKKQTKNNNVTQEQVMDGGGTWTRMSMDTVAAQEPQSQQDSDRVSIHTFTQVGGCYALLFVFMAHILRFHPGLDESPQETSSLSESHSSTAWHVMAYILYATIESFGSLSVATFWSFTNSTLCLNDAERFYGPIIAMAQLGAIAGSTMVTTHYWSFFPLFLVASLVICLQILVMSCYNRRYLPTAEQEPPISSTQEEPREPQQVTHTNAPLPTSSFWPDWSILFSGVQLILKHNYVLLILGVSCLYEVSLTCLDYQMKLIGWNRFEQDEETSLTTMSFTQFMGHYGQVTNVTSLFFSYVCFPYLMKTLGLRYTVRLFPTLLVLATVVAYGAIPGNLAVLFLSMSVLKAMTYSIHDPAKEILYLPTSNAIKFRAKFWIDVVGARIAKAAGSTINTYAGSVDRIVRYGSIPSLLTACALWLVCYRAGIRFDQLVRDGVVVGREKENEMLSQEMVKTDYQFVVSYRDEEEQQQEQGDETLNAASPEVTSS